MDQSPSLSRRQALVLVSAWIAVVLLCGMASAQAGTALGVIPTNVVWGDKHEALTLKLKVSSLLAASALLVMAYVIWKRTQLSSVDTQQNWLRRGSFIIAVYFLIDTILNSVSLNPLERRIYTPVTLVLSICCWIVTSYDAEGHTEPNFYEKFPKEKTKQHRAVEGGELI